MYEPKPADPGEKPFKCEEKPRQGIPDATKPFRELLDALTDQVKALTPPNDASTKFPDELKDVEKEYQGIDAIVAKYKDFYDKQLDCKLADVKRWRASINEWSSSLDDNAKDCICHYRKTKYSDREKAICCNWVELRRKLNGAIDPLSQAKNKEALKQEAYDKLKGFLDTVTKIFTDLEALFKKAEGFNKEGKPKSVFAVSLEFEDLYKLLDWPKTDEEKCPASTGGTQQPGGGYAQQTPPPGGYATTSPPEGGSGQTPESPCDEVDEGYDGDYEKLKKKLSPTELRARLICALRGVVLAKFDRLLVHFKQLKDAAAIESAKTAVEAAKKECDKFRGDRQKLFLELAEEIPTGPGCDKGTGGGTGGGTQQPGGGGYGQQPPGGGYQQQQPPGGGYQEQQPPSGGYEPQAPSGGYDKPPQGKPSGGYGKK